jgi:hypothetical protein
MTRVRMPNWDEECDARWLRARPPGNIPVAFPAAPGSRESSMAGNRCAGWLWADTDRIPKES